MSGEVFLRDLRAFRALGNLSSPDCSTESLSNEAAISSGVLTAARGISEKTRATSSQKVLLATSAFTFSSTIQKAW